MRPVNRRWSLPPDKSKMFVFLFYELGVHLLVIGGKAFRERSDKNISKPGQSECNPRTREPEAEGSRVPGQPGVYSELRANLGYTVTPVLKNIRSRGRAAPFVQLPQSLFLKS